MFIFVCSKFTQETIYQISLESPEFHSRYYTKKHFGHLSNQLYFLLYGAMILLLLLQ